jgi:hypothetical protein
MYAAERRRPACGETVAVRLRPWTKPRRFLDGLLLIAASVTCTAALPIDARCGTDEPQARAAWSHAPEPNGGTPPAAVTDAARRGLRRFLKAIPQPELVHFNFADPTEVELAELGTPFELFTIRPEEILAYEPGTPLDRIVLPMPVWFFPVVVKGESRTLLYVELMRGSWQAVGIGSSGIAKRWAAAQGVRPTVDGHANVFVRVYQARADFVLSTKDSVIQMIPLKSAGSMLSEARERHDPAEVIASLRPSVVRGLAPAGSHSVGDK